MITKWLQRKGFQTTPIVNTDTSTSLALPEPVLIAVESGRLPAYTQEERLPLIQEIRGKMSADTMTDNLTSELKGKSDVLASKIADLNHKMEAVFGDAHVAVDAASAHVEKVAAAVARLKETLPT